MGVLMRPEGTDGGEGETNGPSPLPRARRRDLEWFADDQNLDGDGVVVATAVLDEPLVDHAETHVEGFDDFPVLPPPTTTEPVRDVIGRRVPSLDGLRGLAAAAVV